MLLLELVSEVGLDQGLAVFGRGSSFSYPWEIMVYMVWPAVDSGGSDGASAWLELEAGTEYDPFFFQMYQLEMPKIRRMITEESQIQKCLFFLVPEQMFPDRNWQELLLTGFLAVHVRLGYFSPLLQEILRCELPWDRIAPFCMGLHV